MNNTAGQVENTATDLTGASENEELHVPNFLLESEDDADPHQKAIDQFLASIGSSQNAVVSVWEQKGAHKAPLEFLFQCSPEDYDYEGLISHVQQNHGGGTYRLHVRVSGKLKVNHTFAISGPKKDPLAQVATRPISEKSDISELRSLMSEMHKSNQQLIRELLQDRGSNDPFEMLDKMARLKDFFGGNQPATDPFTSMTKALEMVDKIKLIAGDGEGAGVGAQLVAAVKEYLPQIISVTQKAIDKKPAVVQQRIPVPVTRPANPVQSTTIVKEGQTMNVGNQQLIQLMAPHLKTLCTFAHIKGNVENYAGMIIDMTPDEHLDPLLDFIRQEDSINQLIEIYPPVNNYKEWFLELRDSIIEQLSEDDDTTGNNADEEIPGATGAIPDTVNDDPGRTGGDSSDT